MFVVPDERHGRLTARAAAFAAQFPTGPGPDRHGDFDRQAWRRCADYGLLRMPLPADGAPSGTSLCEIFAVLEGLGYGGLDEGLLFALGAHLWTIILAVRDHGTDKQRHLYLTSLADGTLIGANASTEPKAGSDVFALSTHATRDGHHYVLNGTKTLITNAPIADLFIVYATLDPTLGPMGITPFLVNADTPGLNCGAPLDKMGLRTAPMGELTLENCRVPAENVLGREGRGVKVFTSAMEYERVGLLAPSLGIMRRHLEACTAYARARHQFGQRISQHQAVAHRIVDMRVRLDAARALVYRAAYLKDQGMPASQETAAAKLYVSEAYVQSSLDTMRIHGGQSYLTANGIEVDLRNAIGALFYSGTSDIQRNIIARTLNL
ncbi:MAG: acyl-CoA dehydrogenase [Pseudonocardiales bacterium]|nr:MAG: acyl-CoA dehydrogenase [Pseudonocardiales bacterium]